MGCARPRTDGGGDTRDDEGDQQCSSPKMEGVVNAGDGEAG